MKNLYRFGNLIFILAFLTACANPFWPTNDIKNPLWPGDREPAAESQVPVISIQPQSRNYPFGFEGTVQLLSVTAAITGAGDLSYQWFKTFKITETSYSGEVEIDYATESSFNPEPELNFVYDGILDEFYYFFVRVTNTLNNKEKFIDSEIVTIIVSTPQVPNIELQPASIDYEVGEYALPLVVKASVYDGGTLTYELFRNGSESYENAELIGSGILSEGSTVYNEGTITYPIDTSNESTYYYFVKLTNISELLGPGYAKYEYSNIARIHVKTPVIINPSIDIYTVNISVTAPQKGVTPSLTPTAVLPPGTTARYEIEPAAWESDDTMWTQTDPFRGSSVYTVTVTVLSHDGYVFAIGDPENTDVPSVTAYINRESAVIISNDGDTLVFSYTFAVTEAKRVTSISLKTPPRLNYIHGDHLDVSALVVTRNYDDLTNDDVPFADFGTITTGTLSTSPLNGAVLGHQMNGNQITVTHSGGVTPISAGNLVVDLAPVNHAEVTITAPVINEPPNLSVVSHTGAFTPGSVSWSTSEGSFNGPHFLGDTVYTATVTLNVNPNHIFPEDMTAKINNTDVNDENIVISNNGNNVTLSFTFDATDKREVDYISVEAQPKITYTHGETLDLSNLVVTVTFSDSTSEPRSFASFGATITTIPLNGTQLSFIEDNGNPVQISLGTKNTSTNNLAISQIPVSIASINHTKPYDGNINISGTPPTFTLSGVIDDDLGDVSVNTYIALYTGSDAETDTINVTGYTLTGAAAGNYTVTPTNNVPVTGGITKRALSITGITHTKPYDGGTAVSGATPTFTFGNLILADTDNVLADEYSVVYTNASAGTNTINVTSLTLTGVASGNYLVAPASNVPVTGGGITKKPITITGITHTKPYDNSTSVSGTATFAFSGIITADASSVTYAYTAPAAFTAVYTNANAGTATMNITALTLAGAASGNYSVTLSANNVPVTGGITKAVPVIINWPTVNTVVNAGLTLSAITITPGNPDGTPGNFTWTNGNSTSVGAIGDRQHNMTFTPNDTVNFQTANQNYAITVKGPQTINMQFDITGETLSWTGAEDLYDSDTKTITILRASGPTSITLALPPEAVYSETPSWTINPSRAGLSSTEPDGMSFTFNTPLLSGDYTLTETYTLTLQVKVGGVPYSRTIFIRVTP